MRKLIIAILAVFCLSSTANAAMTYGASNYLDNLAFVNSGDTAMDPIYLFINEVETTIDGTSGVTSIIFTPGTAPSSPSEGQVYYDESSNGLLLYTGSAFVSIDTAGASSGIPPFTAVIRAGFGPTPACQALAKIVWSISCGRMPDLLIVSRTTIAPNSGAVSADKEPPNFPPAVRPAPNMTTSFIIPPKTICL